VEFTQTTVSRMKALQAQLSIVLNRANQERCPADVAAFALARCLRELLDMVPGNGRVMLTDLIVAFLRREDLENDDLPKLLM
jgi:hypothetical protein